MNTRSLLYYSLFAFVLGTSLPMSALAAEINFSADKLNISTDDVVEIRLSVDGKVDNGQVAIEGLEHFTVLERSSSQQIQIINGATSTLQENVLRLQPKIDGNVVLTAVATEDGKEVRSRSLSFTITKSVRQSTKEMLLQESQPEPRKNDLSASDEEVKKLLTADQADTGDSNPDNITNAQGENTTKKTLTVQHQSAFNALFWLQFLGIIALALSIVAGVFWLRRKSDSTMVTRLS